MSDDAPEREEEEARPERRKKRRAEPAAEAMEPRASASGPEPRASASGSDARASIPAFAAAFPRDPALDALVAAFEAGDYARVRREAPALAKQTDRDEVRAAARELARRLDPDPLAARLLGLAVVLLVFLAGWYWLHGHGP